MISSTNLEVRNYKLVITEVSIQSINQKRSFWEQLETNNKRKPPFSTKEHNISFDEETVVVWYVLFTRSSCSGKKQNTWRIKRKHFKIVRVWFLKKN